MSLSHHHTGTALALLLASATAASAHPPAPEEPPPEHKTVVRKARVVRVSNGRKVGGAPLELLPRRTAEDALRLVPGLVLVQHGNEGKGHQIYVRGFDAVHGSDFAVTLDGVLLNELSNVHASGYLDLVGIPTDVIQTVDAVKGPFELSQGLFATAGSAQYNLGVPVDRRGAHVGYEVGPTNRHRVFATVSPSDARDRSFASVELVHDDGFGRSREVDRASFAARSSYDRGADRIELSVVGGLARFELPGTLAQSDIDAGFVDFLGAYDDLSYGESDRFIGVVRHVHETDALRVATSLHAGARRLELSENFTGDLFDAAGDRRWQRERRVHAGLDSTLALAIDEHWQLDAVAGVRVDELFHSEDRAAGRVREEAMTRASAHAGAMASLRVDDVSASMALRAELLDERAVLLPRAQLGWRPGKRFALSASYGRGARPPEIPTGEFTTVDGFELGAHLHLGERTSVTLVGFATLVEREYVFDHVSGASLDLDGSRRVGAELTIETEPIDDLTLRLDATFADARYDRSGNQVAGVPPLLVAGEVFVAPFEHFRAGARVLAMSRRPLAYGATGAGFVTVGLGADYALGAFRFGLSIDNLFDSDNAEGVYHFASHWDRATPPSMLPRLQIVAGQPLTARLRIEVAL